MIQPVAIVGLSLRYPGFSSPASFFSSCFDTSDSRLEQANPRVVSPYLKDSPRAHRDPYRIASDLYGSIRDISWIDSRRFRVPPSDIDGDPSPFLCLQVASEALSDYQAERAEDCIPRTRTGVVIGRGDHPHRGIWSGMQGGGGFEVIRELLLERKDLFSRQQIDHLVDVLLQRMQPYPTPAIAASLVSNVISGLVANRLDLQGPNYLVDAACASAIVAIQHAIRSLYSDETDLMIVGAVQATMSLPIIQMFSMIGAIAEQDIQPFNTQIDGTLLSEGVGFIALKRLEDARKDGDRIYSVIRGLGVASDGNDSSILAPSSRGQILAMHNTYEGLDSISPSDIGFLEAHATGINLGDITELNSIKSIFKPRDRRRPLVLGALKSLIGHSIPASGMAALIRATYAVSYGIYPGSRCDLGGDKSPVSEAGFFLPTKASPWYESPLIPRCAAINCFGFGGINAHLVIQEEVRECDHRLLSTSGLIDNSVKVHISTPAVSSVERQVVSTGSPVLLLGLTFSDEAGLVLSASQALEALVKLDKESRQHTFFFSGGSESLAVFRIGSVFTSQSQLQEFLEFLCSNPDQHTKFSSYVSAQPQDLAVMLPGEAQIPFGHLKELASSIPAVKSLLEFVDSSSSDSELLGEMLHPAWSEILSDSEKQHLQDAVNHHDTATKVLFVVSVAYVGLLRFLGIRPTAFIGHSTGEINALMLAGGLACSDSRSIQHILKEFESLYSDSDYLDCIATGLVVVVSGLDDDRFFHCLEMHDDLFLISDNSPSHRLVFSVNQSLDQISALIAGYGGFVLPTQLNRPYHTPLFEAGAQVMRRFYSRFPLASLHTKVYSCCSGELYPNNVPAQIDLLVKQWVQPVRFREALLNMHRDGIRTFVELNASKTLVGFAELCFRGQSDVSLLSTGSTRDCGAILAFANTMISLWIQGFPVDWSKWHSLFTFPEELDLPLANRPANALTICHDLHQFDSEDYRDAWNLDSQTTNRKSKDLNPTVQDEKQLHQDIDSGLQHNVFLEHQQIMRHLIDSLDKNTRLMIENIGDLSS